ncbi:uncharacterized protein LOC142652871 isoform X5 [Rhinoderma darwinii]|uniref:uncharacterized protein LOC142652871 isoform X5 n=1 Tax=Rhinoderma darwinii TaxID=43563 RepID=UPI003F67B60F
MDTIGTLEPDVFSYSEGDVEQILLGLQGDVGFLTTPSSTDLKRKLENESKRAISLQLHLATLGEYYRQKWIPRDTIGTLEPDVFSYSEGDVEQILLGLQGDVGFLTTPSSTDLKRKLENESKRAISLQLHLATLGEYYRQKRIPRGLSN